MRDIRRKEKEIKDLSEINRIIQSAEFITIAMSLNEEPYLVSLSHGYDEQKKTIYFHCASEGKKIDILKQNNRVWGQAIIDHGYIHSECDHKYESAQFYGRVKIISDLEEKKNALKVMIWKLDENPEEVFEKQINEKSLARVTIGCIDIEYLSGKKSL
ncbi:MAG: pyridoxamine 5'-phosphate oxidase family protein [Candidatus Hodarchaeales archaeon]